MKSNVERPVEVQAGSDSRVVVVLQRATNWAFYASLVALVVTPFALALPDIVAIEGFRDRFSGPVVPSTILAVAIVLLLLGVGTSVAFLIRRHRRIQQLAVMRPDSPVFSRVSAIAKTVGVAEPLIAIEPGSQPYAHTSYNGRSAVLVLSTGFGLLWSLNAALADAIIKHELAHISARDVARTEFVSASVSALLWALVLPSLLAQVMAWLVIQFESPVIVGVFGHLLWGAVVTGIAFLIMIAGIHSALAATIRFRESMADIQAVIWGAREGLLTALRRAGTPVNWFRRMRDVFALHPASSERALTITNPQRALAPSLTFLAGCGFLFGLGFHGVSSLGGSISDVSGASAAMERVAANPFAGSSMAGAVGGGVVVLILFVSIAALGFEGEKIALRTIERGGASYLEGAQHALRASAFWVLGALLAPLATLGMYRGYASRGLFDADAGGPRAEIWLLTAASVGLAFVLISLSLGFASWMLRTLGQIHKPRGGWLTPADRWAVVPLLLIWILGPGPIVFMSAGSLWSPDAELWFWSHMGLWGQETVFAWPLLILVTPITILFCRHSALRDGLVHNEDDHHPWPQS